MLLLLRTARTRWPARQRLIVRDGWRHTLRTYFGGRMKNMEKMRAPVIRSANLADAKRLLEIYDYYVKNTAITFEYDTPSLAEFTARMERTMKRYPYLVVERDCRVEGYAYAGIFKDRAAYDWSCETTIYIAPNERKNGLGRMLYEALEEKLKANGILNLYACIGYPEEEDEYLTKNSAEFHEHLGYTRVGKFHKCGFKFGRWYDMIWMEKIIGEHGGIGGRMGVPARADG